MRLTTWNCYRGDLTERVERLRPLSPDLIALQEVSRPSLPLCDAIWSGNRDAQGVAVVSCNPALAIRKVDYPTPPTALPVMVEGATTFLLLSLWSVPEPTYEAFNLGAIRACREVSFPVVVMGDLNAPGASAAARQRHAEVLRVVREELGCVSAYHAFHRVEHGAEAHPTHFWRWREDAPWHIDFCFIPEGWVGRVRNVEVGSFAHWQDSDHRPLTVELEL
jgi:exodeoxyribonuclease-3